MRRGLERYAPASGYDVGHLGRQKLAQIVTQKAGMFPGDWALDVETGTGILGVQVSRSFTRCKVVATDAERKNLVKARENAHEERCVDRMRFVQCLPEALPFKDEAFYFSTVGFGAARVEEPLDLLEELHRATGFYGKVYMAALDLTRVKPKPRGWLAVVYDEETLAAMREIGFGKVQRLRVMVLPDGAQLDLVTAKRFDAEGAEDDADDSDDSDDE